MNEQTSFTGDDRNTHVSGGRPGRQATAGEHLRYWVQNRAGVTAFLTGEKTATAYVGDEVHLMKLARKGKARRKDWHIEAICKADRRIHFRSKVAQRNYEILAPKTHIVDEAMMRAALIKHVSDTRIFRSGWKEAELKQRGKAHCPRTLWLMSRQDFQQDECLFLPNTKYGEPQKVRFNFQSVPAAKAMLLLTQGHPPENAPQATHKCGMGHMSCVNPKHLAWGSVKTNAEDRTLHNAKTYEAENVGPNLIASVLQDNRLTNVIAWDLRIPKALVVAIKTGEVA